jgi:hypothetical protein
MNCYNVVEQQGHSIVSVRLKRTRALTLTELQRALGVELHEPFLDEENLPEPKDMLAACAGLAAYDERRM